MGFKRVLGSGIAGMLCLLPMAWISFQFLGLVSHVTGGLITGVSDLASAFGRSGQIIIFIVGAILGLVMICLFPIHWALIYNPNDIPLLLSLIVPWILCCAITSGLFAHSPRGGFNTSLAIGIGYLLVFVIGYFAISALLSQIGGAAIINSIVTGLTDMPYLLAVITAILEGSLVGAVFGAFVGSLKYNPEEGSDIPKYKDKSFEPEPTLDSFSSFSDKGSEDIFCTNCGAKLKPGDEFCVNCGAKVK
ncbi:MAG: zinc ribbon domain-containing protein [Promethearchaeota archaeon]